MDEQQKPEPETKPNAPPTKLAASPWPTVAIVALVILSAVYLTAKQREIPGWLMALVTLAGIVAAAFMRPPGSKDGDK